MKHVFSLFVASTVLACCLTHTIAGEPAETIKPNTAAECQEVTCNLLIVGGTESGWAAAIQAARLGVENIVIVHDGRWLGGQYTEQSLVCVDENKGVDKVGWGVDWHPMKRAFHRSGLFKELMDRIEAVNTEKYGSAMPGMPWHGPSTFRPAEAEAVFRAMLQPYLDSGQVTLLTDRYPVRADVNKSGPRPKLTGLWFAPLDSQQPNLHVQAKLTIDASDWGEAVQVSGAGFVAGPDPPLRYGEPSAPTEFPANEMNPITWAMIVEQSDGETPIPKPQRFDDRNYPRATRSSGAEFGGLKWDVKTSARGSLLPWPAAGEASKRQLTVYSVRRVVDGYTSKDGKTAILLNYMNGQDYPLERLPQPVVDALEATEPGASNKNIVVMTRQQRQIVFDDAKQHALGVLYHLQNFAHEHSEDKTNSLRNFHLSEEFGTPDRLPPKPYIRESLRLNAMYVMREQDGRNRDGETKDKARPRFAAVMYPDGMFAWQFHYDFHRTGRTYLQSEGAAGPWIDYEKPLRHTKFISDRSVFPLRSLIPAEMDGLLGAQGNIGVSSIVSAAIRLHDQRVHVGQAAGATAAVSLRTGVAPHEFPYSREQLEAVRHALCGEVEGGVPLLIWPLRDLEPAHPAFVAVNRLAALDLLPLGIRDVNFRADDPADADWVAEIVKRSHAKPSDVAGSYKTKGEFCRLWWGFIQQRGWSEFTLTRKDPQDADGDGIPDASDALLFTPNEPIRFQIERDPLSADRDGVPPETTTAAFAFDFCGDVASAGFTADRGQEFDQQRGFGWSRDLRENHRRRHALAGPRDTFVFTRDKDRWECAVENGRYRVTLCVGDSGHEQLQQSVAVEGQRVLDKQTTLPGEFREVTINVEVRDGRLTLDLGSGLEKSNTCLNWLLVSGN